MKRGDDNDDVEHDLPGKGAELCWASMSVL